MHTPPIQNRNRELFQFQLKQAFLHSQCWKEGTGQDSREREKQTPFSLPHLVRNSQLQEAPSKNRDFQNITSIFKSTESANTLPGVASVFANSLSAVSFDLEIPLISLTPYKYHWLNENPQNSVCVHSLAHARRVNVGMWLDAWVHAGLTGVITSVPTGYVR